MISSSNKIFQSLWTFPTTFVKWKCISSSQYESSFRWYDFQNGFPAFWPHQWETGLWQVIDRLFDDDGRGPYEINPFLLRKQPKAGAIKCRIIHKRTSVSTQINAKIVWRKSQKSCSLPIKMTFVTSEQFCLWHLALPRSHLSIGAAKNVAKRNLTCQNMLIQELRKVSSVRLGYTRKTCSTIVILMSLFISQSRRMPSVFHHFISQSKYKPDYF